MAYEFNREYESSLNGTAKSYVSSYALLKNRSTFIKALRLAIKKPPLRINKKGKLFFSYLMVVYYNDFNN